MRDHGNSGRPLLNDQGQVIGITSQIYADGSTSGNVGIGFAVPSATVQRLASELIANGKATHPTWGSTSSRRAAAPGSPA